MAYVDQAKKQVLVAAVKSNLKKVLGKNELKVTFSVSNHSTIVATIVSGTIDFGNCHQQVNHYWLDENFDGMALTVLKAIRAGLMTNHYDNSDAQSDYFDCAHYISINVGRWNKPYEFKKV